MRLLASICFSQSVVVSRLQYLGGGGKTFQGVHTAVSG